MFVSFTVVFLICADLKAPLTHIHKWVSITYNVHTMCNDATLSPRIVLQSTEYGTPLLNSTKSYDTPLCVNQQPCAIIHSSCNTRRHSVPTQGCTHYEILITKLCRGVSDYHLAIRDSLRVQRGRDVQWMTDVNPDEIYIPGNLQISTQPSSTVSKLIYQKLSVCPEAFLPQFSRSFLHLSRIFCECQQGSINLGPAAMHKKSFYQPESGFQ